MMETACKIYKGTLSNGYPAKGNIRFHRLVMNAPKGTHVHHKCHNRSCINPEHLDILTPSEHAKITRAEQERITECRYGHKYTKENTITHENGHRQCRICQNKCSLESYHRRKYD